MMYFEAKGSGFSRVLSRATDHQEINPIAVAARQSGADKSWRVFPRKWFNRSKADAS